MSKSLKFIWIDDDPLRKRECNNLGQSLDVSIKFIDVKNDDQALKDVLSENEPNLILIDHNLNDIISGVFKKGSTVAVYIRETWPECPIICVTGEDINEVDSQNRLQYEDVFEINKISNYYSTILSIANSFKYLKKRRPKTLDDFLDLIDAPKKDYERLKTIIPKELKEYDLNKSLLLDISHWVRKVLIKRPGFLYDRLWAATLLGIKESSLNKVEHLFERAKYTGIFMDGSNERWWKSKLLNILSSNIQERGLPWEKGRKMPNIEKDDFSKCYATGKYFPETVAYVDETPKARCHPMLLKETVVHPNYEDLLFFEEIRMMKPAE